MMNVSQIHKIRNHSDVKVVVGNNHFVEVFCIGWEVSILHMIIKPVVFKVRLKRLSSLFQEQTDAHALHIHLLAKMMNNQMALKTNFFIQQLWPFIKSIQIGLKNPDL